MITNIPADLQLLENNFIELAVVEKPSQLIAAPWGSRLYDNRFGWGKFRHIIYKIFFLVLPPDYQKYLVLQALKKTQNIFEFTLKNALIAASYYQSHLCSALDDEQKEQMRLASKIILKWHEATGFLKKIKAACCNSLFDIESSDRSSLKICQAVIDLEGFIGNKLPVTAFRKILLNEEIDGQDEQNLAYFVSQINTLSISEKQLIIPLHRALVATARCLFPKLAKHSWQLRLKAAHLEIELIKLGCIAFSQKEKKIIKMCRQWHKKKSEVLAQKLEAFKLSPPNRTIKNKKFFSLFNYPNAVLLVAHNKAIASIEAYLAWNNQVKSLASRKIFSCETPPYCIVAERFKGTFTSSNLLDKNQKNTLIINLIKNWLKNSICSTPLKISNLKINSENKLCWKKRVKDRPFDFNKVEEFIFSYVPEEPVIFAKVILETGMFQQQTAKLYCSRPRRALDDTSSDVATFAAIQHIDSAEIVDKAKNLCQNLLDTRKKLEKPYVKAGLKSQELQKIRQQVNFLLFQEYMKSGGVSRLFVNFEELSIKLKNSCPQKKLFQRFYRTEEGSNLQPPGSKPGTLSIELSVHNKHTTNSSFFLGNKWCPIEMKEKK